MPIIGLYVTVATLVCLLLISMDIFLGFRRRKKWLPCNLFALNSATLAVLAVATKLPGDLTSSMPSTLDQLSKLAGTTFICITMAFLMPSVGLTSFSESISNMISLTIFVITVFVDVCIQMHTGVITSFKADHIVVLCCMIVLLIEMWTSTFTAEEVKDSSSLVIKDSINRTKISLLERLKACYLFGYQKNPQFSVSRRFSYFSSCIVSIVCAAILLGEILRCFVSKELEFRKGQSDYKWSMQGIVVSQTITVLLGCFGTTIRFLSLVKHPLADELIYSILDAVYPGLSPSFALALLLHPFIPTIYLLVSLYYLVAVSGLWEKARESVDEALFNFCDEPKDGVVEVEEMMTKECKALISSGKWELDEWAFKKGVKDMMRMMRFMSKTKLIPIHLIQLLHKTPPSRVSLAILLQNRRLSGSEEYKVCPVSVFVLAKIIMLSIPPSMSQCIYDSLKDFYVAIQYISKKVSSTAINFGYNSFDYGWSVGYFGFLNNDEKPKPEEDFQSQVQLDQALEIIRDVKVKSVMALYCIDQSLKNEIAMISGFVESKVYASVEDLYRDMEQLFVDMIRELLLQLASIVLKEIVGSSREDLEEKVKEALKVVSKFEQLRDLGPLSFLVGTTITTTDSATNATLENNTNVMTTAVC
ncbi:hypothetical protein Syun_006223 [Stephania yunnanensis]|uniref:Uncharacterized protein n=1 Tax=Stephania yunnanensis TaxID=152371 RepID=A0AAP0KW69_9MAGN